MLEIKVLGPGCKRCQTLENNTKIASEKLQTQSNVQSNVQKVTDYGEIASYGVVSTPALVINDRVVSAGKVLNPDEILALLQKYV